MGRPNLFQMKSSRGGLVQRERNCLRARAGGDLHEGARIGDRPAEKFVPRILSGFGPRQRSRSAILASSSSSSSSPSPGGKPLEPGLDRRARLLKERSEGSEQSFERREAFRPSRGRGKPGTTALPFERTLLSRGLVAAAAAAGLEGGSLSLGSRAKRPARDSSALALLQASSCRAPNHAKLPSTGGGGFRKDF